ncbi:NAD-P-binding protein [Amylostereum chailletii]|nr:NAD-P-binding protein [Amylostereum chailletii]
MSRKVVICGAGFIGSRIATTISHANESTSALRRIQISSRSPDKIVDSLRGHIVQDHLLPAVPVDITKPETLASAFEGAHYVVSMVGILTGSPEAFERIQWKGAENVARATAAAGAKLVHISAIGADKLSQVPYERTKALGEEVAFKHCPDATVIRPSLVFGPGDGFFNRFAQLSKYLPFLPVFGNGSSKFQPVFVDDLARLVEILTRENSDQKLDVTGKIIEAGGPQVFSFKEIMQLVLKYTHRTRPIIPVPWSIGELQGLVLERLPSNVFTLTRDQVEQLKRDNIVSSPLPPTHVSFEDFLQQHGCTLRSVHEILPTYLR